MKIKVDSLILSIIFLNILFVKGIFGEIIFLLCLGLLVVINYGHFRSDNGRTIKSFIYVYIIIFVLLYIYICWHYKFEMDSMIRFMGYTKCICSVVIAMMTFGISAKKINYLNFAMSWTIIIDLSAYLEDIITKTALNPDSWVIGASANVMGGLNNIILAFILFKKMKSFSTFEKVFLIVSVVYILSSNSQTAQIMLIIQFVVKIIMNIKGSSGLVRKTITLSIIIISILGIYLIVNYGFRIDNLGVLDRYNIWNRAINQFSQRSLVEKIIGNGNNVVQMQFVTFIPHNFVLEVMMLYGYLGVCLVVGLLLVAISVIRKIESSFTKTTMTMSLLMFICELFFHPAFTTCLWLELLYFMVFLQCAYAEKRI